MKKMLCLIFVLMLAASVASTMMAAPDADITRDEASPHLVEEIDVEETQTQHYKNKLYHLIE
jgi:hypothetical protein